MQTTPPGCVYGMRGQTERNGIRHWVRGVRPAAETLLRDNSSALPGVLGSVAPPSMAVRQREGPLRTPNTPSEPQLFKAQGPPGDAAALPQLAGWHALCGTGGGLARGHVAADKEGAGSGRALAPMGCAGAQGAYRGRGGDSAPVGHEQSSHQPEATKGLLTSFQHLPVPGCPWASGS